MFTLKRLESFQMSVGIKFQLYNSLFTSLPFHRIENTGILLSLFLHHCEESYKKRWSPAQIVEQFFDKYTFLKTSHEKMDLLFRFVQYAERQVVLFDAVEDAAFEEVNDLHGAGSLKELESRVRNEGKEDELLAKLQSFAVMLVLTAHPTQFYPGSVLGIINDLSAALSDNDAASINSYLQQLGKTPLFKKHKPTPYDEAVSLIWYLENVFYHAIGQTMQELKTHFPAIDLEKNAIIQMGFWPGGDRDGNPNVSSAITVSVANALHASIIRSYYQEARRLKRRLTFKGVDTIVSELESKLYQHSYADTKGEYITANEILQPLLQIRDLLVNEHNSLFLPELESLVYKVRLFGVHFATLDIRQESSVHSDVMEAIAEKESRLANYLSATEEEKVGLLASIDFTTDPDQFDGIVKDTLLSVDAIREIQSKSGEKGCHRYIISQCGSVLDLMHVYALFLLRGWKKEDMKVDIIPLFETVDDLRNAAQVMKALYENADYAAHLKRRGSKQVIMVGFSDGTKDGGYLMANWSIYKAKQELTAVSRQYGVKVVFFDGRGGPPARGGGKTHRFYASMGKTISTDGIQLTVQGQTVSSNFGIIGAARYNVEQLLSAGVTNELFREGIKTLSADQQQTVQQLADSSYEAYKALKEHPGFLTYLSDVSPLKYYAETNISSRPSKRGGSSRLSLKDLRAIPFVGAWSQLKQNVPGYYGLGTALETIEKEGKLDEIKRLYERSAYFRTLLDNCEMAMKKSYFPLTSYLADDPQYGPLWKMIHEEYERTEKYLQKLSGHTELMQNYPVDQLSIQMRERIVLPLTTIQQYALSSLRDEKPKEEKERTTLEKLIIRSSFGIINASRNSV
ncbi:MAG: phosphoenolpyruvate carboxylase [Chitinophagaceae bacterium]|nr:MAG: phosphoenolpyruvate carboxylase [Chitinophagaceae bacterium]